MEEKPTYGDVTWSDDDEMVSRHVVDDYVFVIRGYESSADEYQVSGDDGTPVFYYMHSLGGRVIQVKGDHEPEQLVCAALALVDRMDVVWGHTFSLEERFNALCEILGLLIAGPCGRT